MALEHHAPCQLIQFDHVWAHENISCFPHASSLLLEGGGSTLLGLEHSLWTSQRLHLRSGTWIVHFENFCISVKWRQRGEKNQTGLIGIRGCAVRPKRLTSSMWITFVQIYDFWWRAAVSLRFQQVVLVVWKTNTRRSLSDPSGDEPDLPSMVDSLLTEVSVLHAAHGHFGGVHLKLLRAAAASLRPDSV